MTKKTMKGSEGVFVLGSQELKLEAIEVKGLPKYYLRTTISTGDVDLVNDVVTEKCMESMIEQLRNRTIKLDFEHEAFRGETSMDQEFNKTRIPLGKRTDFQRGKTGVDVTWELNQNWKKFDDSGRIVFSFDEIKQNIDEGYYDGTSIAFIPTSTAIVEKDNGETIRLLDDVILLNVALTGNPVNTHATVNEIFTKSLDEAKAKEDNSKKPEDEEEAEEDKCNKKPQKKDHTLIKLHPKEEKMAEKEQKAEEEEGTQVADAPVVDAPEVVAEAEQKSLTELKAIAVGLKGLSAKFDALNKEVSELKAEMSAPQMKAVSEQAKATTEANVQMKSISPLGLIG